jgi:hypothetical protein
MFDKAGKVAKAGKVPDDLDKGDGPEDGDLDALEEHRGGEPLKSLAAAREASQCCEVFQRVFPGRGRIEPRGGCGCSSTLMVGQLDNLGADGQLDFDRNRKKRRRRSGDHVYGGHFEFEFLISGREVGEVTAGLLMAK